MKSTDIIFAPSSERELKKLAKDRQKDVIAALRRLCDGSETLEIEKIKGHPSFFRLKAGRDMRVIYHPLSGTRIVVLVIRDRKEAYRGLGDLGGKLQAALHKAESVALRTLGMGG
jgi:mRNA-degrading endonuclease RelE of RelBE toxin-antitoxin system